VIQKKWSWADLKKVSQTGGLKSMAETFK
jgi:hypothetical protein